MQITLSVLDAAIARQIAKSRNVDIATLIRDLLREHAAIEFVNLCARASAQEDNTRTRDSLPTERERVQ